jgi:hypothetical protein
VKVPKAEQAIIEVAKLRDYLLSASHPVGRFKAAFFRALGYTPQNCGELEAALRRLVETVDVESEEATEYGQKYRVSGQLTGSAGIDAIVVTVWIVLRGESQPRFVTAFPGQPS